MASLSPSVGVGGADALLAVLPPPGPPVELDPTRLLDTVTGIDPNQLEPAHT
ncbi:MAG: hypothetical protein ACRD0G_11850 [Acidimicrobiales bacterium]